MWTVVFVTNKHELAESLRNNLQNIGILSRIKISENQDADESVCIEILVPYSEVDEALNFIIDSDI